MLGPKTSTTSKLKIKLQEVQEMVMPDLSRRLEEMNQAATAAAKEFKASTSGGAVVRIDIKQPTENQEHTLMLDQLERGTLEQNVSPLSPRRR